jgi:nicotinamidase-related amidase
MCVLKSAVDAFELGLTPYVIADASASHAGPRAHEAGLYLLARFIGARQVLSGDDLGGRASSDARPAAGFPPP